MENLTNLSSEALKELILGQKQQINEAKEKIEKYQIMTKHREEHLSRLERKFQSVLEEKQHLTARKKKLTRELDLLSGSQPEVFSQKEEISKALEFVKQTPESGISYLIKELNEIHSELTESTHQNSNNLKKIYQVHFKSESCYIRASTNSYTFKDLANDAAVYFSLIPEDCLLKDESGSIWPGQALVSSEYTEKNQLILGIKFGRIVRNQNSSNIVLEDLAAELRLETRLERMKNWVIEKRKNSRIKSEKDKSVVKRIFLFGLYVAFFVMLCITVLVPYSLHRISIQDAYYLNNGLINLLVTQSFPQYCSYPQGLSIQFSNIFKPSQFFCWFQYIFISQLFNSPDITMRNNTFFFMKYNQMGGIRLKQSRVRSNSCEALNYETGKVDVSQKCYGEYSLDTMDTQTFGKFEEGYNCTGVECEFYKAFMYNSSPSQGYSVQGNLAAYDESGFLIDSDQIMVNGTLSNSVLDDLLDYLTMHLWIDEQTRAVEFHVSFYNINYNYFTNLELVLEISGTGFVKALHKIHTLYLDYYYSSWNNMKNSASDFLIKVPELYCYVYIFAILLPNLIQKLRRNTLHHLKRAWTYIEIIIFLLVFGMVIVRVILYFICGQILSYISNNSFNKVIDLSSAKFYLAITWGLESFSVLMAALNLLNYFPLQSMTLIWDTLYRGSKSIFSFIVIYTVLICSFTQMTHIIYGGEISIFSKFSTSISTLFLITMGSTDQYSIMSESNPIFTPIFYIVYMFLTFFLMMNIFVAIINESYSIVVDLHEQGLENKLVVKIKNSLFSEIKLFLGKIQHSCRKCWKRNKVKRSLAFQAFNRN